MKQVYLDYNGSAPLDPLVADAMLPTLTAGIGNASASHRFGRYQTAAVDKAREQVAALVGGRPGDVVFTAGATYENGDTSRRLPNTASIRFEGADAEAVVTHMDPVAVSTGSACCHGRLDAVDCRYEETAGSHGEVGDAEVEEPLCGTRLVLCCKELSDALEMLFEGGIEGAFEKVLDVEVGGEVGSRLPCVDRRRCGSRCPRKRRRRQLSRQRGRRRRSCRG